MSKHCLSIFVIVAMCLITCCRSKKNDAEAKHLALENRNRTAIAELAKRYNADDAWPKAFSNGEAARLTPILTIELERYWLTDRPILFLGTIKDIRTEDQDNYRIIVDYAIFSPLNFLFLSQLELSLVCPKVKIDSFMKNEPDFLNDFGGEVALIAKVDSIEVRYKVNSEGDEEDIKMGKGRCIDLIYIRMY